MVTRPRAASTLFAALLLLALLCLPGAPAHAQVEQIVSFDSRIKVEINGDLLVTETIRVTAAGDHIKRGIFRDFPTVYRNRTGHTVKVGFDVLDVRRDGSKEPFHTESIDRGVRTYVGDKNVLLPPGTYTYTIVYRTTRQLGFYEAFDELHWNVTGNGWIFAILKASATIELPPGAEVRQQAAYTGPFGAQDQDFVAGRDAQGNVTFATTRVLQPNHGLTVAVAWQKGLVLPPSPTQQLFYFIGDNALSIVTGIGALVLLVYYFFAWLAVGRDPAKGTIVPLFHPPQDLSPGACRFIERMGFDDKIFAATLVNLAIKGLIQIADHDGALTLHKAVGKSAPMTDGEREAMNKLFASAPKVELKKGNHAVLGGARKALRRSMEQAYEWYFFRRNRTQFLVGIGISVLTLVLGIATVGEPSGMVMLLWLSGWTAGVYFLLHQVVKAWRARQVLAGIFTTLFAIPFVLAEIFVFGLLAYEHSWVAALAMIVSGGAHTLFHRLLKAPTRDGRRVMDQIEGFRLYLSVGERDRLEHAVPPERTPELFERYLPYALALGVEQKWSQQFADILAKAGAEPGRGYAPSWYAGRSWASTTAFTTALAGSFASTLASAATAPSSSSGSGGSGSSGSGGGGGGGGGW
ncbi:MAG: DUF2207 domain-containing protein [Alphaproteobacteria bacterium]